MGLAVFSEPHFRFRVTPTTGRIAAENLIIPARDQPVLKRRRDPTNRHIRPNPDNEFPPNTPVLSSDQPQVALTRTSGSIITTC